MPTHFRGSFRLQLFALLTISLVTIQTAQAVSGVEFFAARSFGGDNAMYYATSAGDFDGDGKADVVTASYDKLYVYFGDGSRNFDAIAADGIFLHQQQLRLSLGGRL